MNLAFQHSTDTKSGPGQHPKNYEWGSCPLLAYLLMTLPLGKAKFIFDLVKQSRSYGEASWNDYLLVYNAFCNW